MTRNSALIPLSCFARKWLSDRAGNSERQSHFALECSMVVALRDQGHCCFSASFIYEEVSSSSGFLGLSSSKPFKTSERTGLTALIPCSAAINACARKRLNSRPVLG